jgi:hypothetical protein
VNKIAAFTAYAGRSAARNAGKSFGNADHSGAV